MWELVGWGERGCGKGVIFVVMSFGDDFIIYIEIEII